MGVGRGARVSALAVLLLLRGAVAAQVYISEVDAFGTVEDDLGRGEDWIELVNAGEDSVDLGALRLSDDPDDWGKWSLPPVALAPGEHRLFLASGRDIRAVDHWECPADDADNWRYLVPQGALDADWRQLGFDDGAWNTGPGSIGYGDGDDAVVVAGDVVLMRKVFSVAALDELVHGWLSVDYDDGYVAFLNGRELSRSSTMHDQPIALDTWANGAHEAVLYQGGIPDAVAFDPREWLVSGPNVLAIQVHNVSPNSSDLTARPFLAVGRNAAAPVPFGALPDWWTPSPPRAHTNFKLKPGEPVILSDAEGNLVDAVPLPNELRSGIVVQRQPDGGVCFSTTGSPGEANSAPCFAHIAPSPVVSPPSGWYTAPLVTAVAGSPQSPPAQPLPPMTLRYTTDGSEPSEDAPVFTGFWTPSETAVLSIRAFGEGMLPSATVDRSYLIGEPQSGLETVSIVTHPDHLWDWNSGIYVLGPNAGPDYPFLGANFWQPWSRESRLTWFDGSGSPIAESRFDLEIHGGWSRAEPQRSFRLDFKPRYTGPLEHAVFPSKPWISRFGNLNLRNGGQSSWENKIQDAFYGELALETHCPASAWRPVEVYLNGEYWGVYGAREKSDEQFVEDNFGWEEEGVDLLNQWESLHGAPSAFESTVDPLLLLPDGSSAFHQAFGASFDVGAYIDYHILEIHGQNVDWMTAPWGLKNLKYFRSTRGDGLWRPILYDTDACFGAWATSPFENYLALAVAPPFPSRFSALLDKVLADAEYGCRFATRTCDLLGTAFAPARFDARLNAAAAAVAPAMAHHIARWGSPASLDYWEQRLDLMRNHNAERIAPERDQVRTFFGFAAPVALTLNWSPPFGGEVQVNGMDGLGNGWSSLYFGECPIRLAAIPGPGQGFLGWEANLHTDLDLVDALQPFVEVALQGDDLFFAQFGPCLGGAELAAVHADGALAANVQGSPVPLAFDWYLDGVWVGTGATFQPVEEGVYVLTGSSATCVLVSAPLAWPGDGEIGPLNVGAVPNRPAGLEVVPNPAVGPVMLTGAGSGELTVCAPDGRVVLSEHHVVLPFSLPVEGWPRGVYAIQLKEHGALRFTRFVVP